MICKLDKLFCTSQFTEKVLCKSKLVVCLWILFIYLIYTYLGEIFKPKKC